MREVFFAFLRLGLTAFGGPVAHIGFFREEFVARRRWLTDAAYADLIALCQFLPGPASSQAGFAIGLMRAGPAGALAAWVGFTLPSALLMSAAALSLVAFSAAVPAGLLAGLKAVVVGVVAHALMGMARSLTPDMPRLVLAGVAAAIAIGFGGVAGQLAAIAAGAMAGFVLFARAPQEADRSAEFAAPLTRRVGVSLLGAVAAGLVLLPLAAAHTSSLALDIADGFYRSGALVFGGGHVVLPLLQAEMVAPGLVDVSQFTAGYGLAQAMPGPLFSVAAFLGAAAATTAGAGTIPALGMAVLALVMLFLPGVMLVAAVLPFWARLRQNRTARAALLGVNAAVVGILAAALYHPIATSALTAWTDVLIAAAAFAVLAYGRVPVWALVPAGAVAGVLFAQLA